METHHIERENGALGGLFHQIIQDMKNGMPLWEDLIAKATKLHSSLKATILAVTAYLEAFQKIADSATNARGATREIGTALTRICLRHKAVEARMKTFTSTIMDCLVFPLQEKLEEWKKTVMNLDRDHAKDYKRARNELKKRSTDTLRLQKKMRKGAGGDLQKRIECGLQDVTERRQMLEETEKHAVRAALLEERSRFCTFVGFLKPVVDEEVAMLTEMSHLQEAVQQLEKHTTDPQTLPPASEQVIADLKSSDSGWSFQTPPSSPSSLGSRKSSMCSISSLNSSSSGSSKSHHSPSHPHWSRSLSQPVGRSGTIRYMSVSSQDSGFTSQDTLYPRPPSSFSVAQVSNMCEHSGNSSSSSTPCTPFPASSIPNNTWPNLQESIQFERAASAIINDRPHTISSAYEKGHQRSPLTVYTFQAPEQSLSQPSSPVAANAPNTTKTAPPKSPAPSTKSLLSKPPLPTRCSSLERNGPNVPAKNIAGMHGIRVLPPTTVDQALMKKPSALPAHLAKNCPQPTYVNMHDLANMAANKSQELNLPPPPAEFTMPSTENQKMPNEGEKESSTSESSLESSSGYGSQTTFNVDDVVQTAEDVSDTASKYCTLPRNSDLHNGVRRRPVSMTVYSTGTIRNNLLRRGSVQANKPLPPIRRTSSITSTSGLGQNSNMGSLENLPPPPAFLLEPNTCQNANQVKQNIGVNVAETVKALTELKHTPASPNAIRRTSSQNIYQNQNANQPQGPMLSTFQNKVSYLSQSGGVVYAQPSQILSGSPTAIRRYNNMRSQSADRKSDGPGGVGSNFIASLSAKLAPTLSPRSSRRNSEDVVMRTNTANKIYERGPGQNFLDSLNAKLAQQHINSSPQLKANKIRQFFNSKAQPDPRTCHESLMDQIKRGAPLKRAKIINDRSAPKIY
ncbi:protein MTSS 2 isoform X2 [Coccinella septempunctata]|uniref:protein MTSS 2 isoform X2 n=1 Tax=Coccinella septempunctata TaxID=41139 RepID=UPI001D08EC1F|nr:protein MTSS 2 isoform X2 [Coccinella septempunctata]